MRVVGVIPSRYDSTRLPGKPLADICGKPMIQYVYERATGSKLLGNVIVATDDERIVEAVQGFGGEVALTSPDHPNGTSRVAEVARNMDTDIVINIQGDEPLIDSRMIDEVVQLLLSDPDVVTATLCSPLDDPAMINDPNVVKVVLDRHGDALYFSRSPIPYRRNETEDCAYYEHIGIYGFRKEFLLRYVELPETPLSRLESLEQLRILESGYPIRVGVTKYPHGGPNVNTPEDLEKVREMVRRTIGCDAPENTAGGQAAADAVEK